MENKNNIKKDQEVPCAYYEFYNKIKDLVKGKEAPSCNFITCNNPKKKNSDYCTIHYEKNEWKEKEVKNPTFSLLTPIAPKNRDFDGLTERERELLGKLHLRNEEYLWEVSKLPELKCKGCYHYKKEIGISEVRYKCELDNCNFQLDKHCSSLRADEKLIASTGGVGNQPNPTEKGGERDAPINSKTTYKDNRRLYGEFCEYDINSKTPNLTTPCNKCIHQGAPCISEICEYVAKYEGIECPHFIPYKNELEGEEK